MMRIVIAPDSFKECLSSVKVAEAIAQGIAKVIPEACINSVPFADGGEGTVKSLISATSGHIIPVMSVDALERPIQSYFGVLGNSRTAIVEMASASGIELLAPKERNPLKTTTLGTGILIKAAMEAGFRKIIVAIGGSATNDGGTGMAKALGFKLLDMNNLPIGPGGGELDKLHRIDISTCHPLLKKTEIIIASDVIAPLLGSKGASLAYGPQKGADPEMANKLEQNMTHLAKILLHEFGTDYSEVPGAGAAGGLGAGLMAFCNAKTRSGFSIVAELTRIEELIGKATIVFTGEGEINPQTTEGKVVGEISRMAKKYGVPVIALCGAINGSLAKLHEQGLTAAFAIANRPMSLDESKTHAASLLETTAEQTTRLWTQLLRAKQ